MSEVLFVCLRKRKVGLASLDSNYLAYLKECSYLPRSIVFQRWVCSYFISKVCSFWCCGLHRKSLFRYLGLSACLKAYAAYYYTFRYFCEWKIDYCNKQDFWSYFMFPNADLSTWKNCSLWDFDHNSIQNTIIFSTASADAVENSQLSKENLPLFTPQQPLKIMA